MTDARRADTDEISAFEEHFGGAPTHVVRAPGRVNLLGEHTDYNDLPVLPMAIQREARIVLRPRDDGMVVIRDANPEFPPIEFEIRPGIERDADGHWANYAKAPADELARRFAIWRGFDGFLTSDIPVAAGLSSSSAIVNAVGLALAHINEVLVEERAFAELMADAERYVGTRGGGMDQAVSLAARAGCATKISFAPLRLAHVSVPEEWRFVVADTGARAEKSGPAQKAYNLRRSECEDALSKLVDVVVQRGLARTTPARYPDLLRALGPDRALELAEEALERSLFRRVRHVITEAGRVEEGVDRLRGADLASFGTLMDASHGSLRTDFLVSSGELDDLVAIAKEGGAVGARLTGAGFGGCIVALSDRTTVDAVVGAVVDEYLTPRKLGDRVDDHVFVAVPSAGATFRPLS
jgi:galactokinase